MSISYIIVFSIIILIIILLYFIEPLLFKEKIKNTNEHGSARWSTLSEIKKNFEKENISNIYESGFPVYYSKDNKKVWFDRKTPHWIHLGSTGSGKSVTSVIPMCSFIATSKNKKSVFITDPKGEIFATTSEMFRKNGYNVLTLDFRNPEYSNHSNLLEPIIEEYELYDKYKKMSDKEKSKNKKIDYQNKSILHFAEANKLVTELSTMIMDDETAREKFWNNSSSDLLYGIIFLFLEEYVDGKINRNQITLTSIKKFQSSSMTDNNNKELKKYIETKTYDMKSKDKLLSLLNTSETTYRSITSTFNERMALYDDINVENVTSNSDFKFDCFGKEYTVLYCIIPDESKIYYSLISIIVSLIYKTLVMLCNEQPNKRLPVDLVFILDEFANTPPLNDITTMISVARSRGMFFHFYLQSFAQLDNLYGKEVSQVIQDNCGLEFLKTNTQSTAEAISSRLGTHGVETTSLNYTLSLFNNNGSKNTSLISRSLMTADEIKQLEYKSIIFSTIGHPIIRDTITYDKFSCYQDGKINRKKSPLERLTNTYFTVDDIANRNNNQTQEENNELNEEDKKSLESIVKSILLIFVNVDYEVEYINKDNIASANLYLSSPMSNSDIYSLSNLSQVMNFYFTVITDKTKIGKKNRNSKIEIFLNKGV